MKSSVSILALGAILGLAGLTGSPVTAGEPEPAKPADAAKSRTPGDPYTLATCPVSGKALGSMGDPIVKTYDGREVRFCCKMCPPRFESDLAASMAALDEAMIKDQLPLYPIDTSVVSGKKLPAKPVDWVYNNRLVRLSDDAEKSEFRKDPAKYLAALDAAAIQKQSAAYPLKTCPVSKEELGAMGEAKDIVVGGRLVRLCCGSCEKDVRKDPARFIAMVDPSRKEKADH